MQVSSSGGGGGLVVIGKQYDPYTGKWHDVYGPDPNSGKKKTTPKSTNKKKPSKPNKPTTADKGNADQGSGKDDKKEVDQGTREIEYDLQGTASIRPLPHLSARDIVDFQGMGINFSGKYFVTSVTHTINRSGYTQDLDLLRSDFVWKTSPTAPAPSNGKKPPKKAPTDKNKKPNNKRYYTVKRGDTLWAISKRFYGTGIKYMKIVNANKGKIKNPHWIYPGQKFLIP